MRLRQQLLRASNQQRANTNTIKAIISTNETLNANVSQLIRILIKRNVTEIRNALFAKRSLDYYHCSINWDAIKMCVSTTLILFPLVLGESKGARDCLSVSVCVCVGIQTDGVLYLIALVEFKLALRTYWNKQSP